MVFYRKKSSPIDRRLEELRKEMTRVNRNLKTAARSGPPCREGLSVKPPAPFMESVAPGASSEVMPSTGGETSAGDSPVPPPKTRAAGPSQPAELFHGLSATSIIPSPNTVSGGGQAPRSGREKFAHYFMAGHFQNLRPSRQESRIVRNKAILMLIAVAGLLAWLFYFLRSH